MPKRETRLPCPSCLGVVMEKLKPVKDAELVLDYCRRCGGVWFDAGEVMALRDAKPKGLGQTVALRETAFQMPCHSCRQRMDRNAPKCPHCGWTNEIECPSCHKVLKRIDRDGLVLDACKSCKGVWFDNHELAQIWNMEVRRNVPTVKQSDGSEVVAHYFLLDALLWAPDVAFISASGVAHGVGAAGEAAAGLASGGVEGVAEAAGGAVEAVGDAAGSVFEVIAEIIGGIF